MDLRLRVSSGRMKGRLTIPSREHDTDQQCRRLIADIDWKMKFSSESFELRLSSSCATRRASEPGG